MTAKARSREAVIPAPQLAAAFLRATPLLYALIALGDHAESPIARY